jgi:hypothetical protein
MKPARCVMAFLPRALLLWLANKLPYQFHETATFSLTAEDLDIVYYTRSLLVCHFPSFYRVCKSSSTVSSSSAIFGLGVWDALNLHFLAPKVATNHNSHKGKSGFIGLCLAA